MVQMIVVVGSTRSTSRIVEEYCQQKKLVANNSLLLY